MDIKIQVKPMAASDIPSVWAGKRNCQYQQFTDIIEKFNASESECISLLSGDEIDSKTLNNIKGNIVRAIKNLGLEDVLKVTVRNMANNIYIVKKEA